RIVQTGTQSRSAAGVRSAIQYIHEGKLGKILVARGLCYKRRRSIGRVRGVQPIPETVDYDLWTGPARLEGLRRERLHYDWHWVWNTGSGDIGNQGIHQMDIARWALGVNSLSSRVTSFGGRYGYIDDGQTPNTQIAIHEFEPGSSPYADGRPLLIFEVRGLDTEGYRGVKTGNVIECERGYLTLDTGGGRAFDNDGNQIRTFERGTPAGGDHYENFIAAVRSRDASTLRSDILEGHLSSALCHTGNISHRLGEPVAIDTATSAAEQIAASAGEGVERLWQHVGRQYVDYVLGFGRKVVVKNGIDPVAGLRLVQGPSLEMNAARERFTNSESAHGLLRRDYRAPYVVPDVV
ncbi:MAG: gfo/Idh/MocA family oxidoreductase, partial [Planctomycetes bacterium]|nr:gfo/Idh/MocA family oxidoreductase [Planctomycetota bacterium]